MLAGPGCVWGGPRRAAQWMESPQLPALPLRSHIKHVAPDEVYVPTSF